jgi:hypothetical protein
MSLDIQLIQLSTRNSLLVAICGILPHGMVFDGSVSLHGTRIGLTWLSPRT